MRASAPILIAYLSRRWWFAASTFTGIFVVVLMLLYAAEVMGDIAGGEIPVSMLGWQVLLHVPDVVRTVLPLGMVMAVLLTRQQMRRDAEWEMLTVCGLQPGQLRAGLMVFMASGFVLLLLISGWLQPAAKSMQASLYQRAANSAEFWGVLPGRFNTLRENDGVIYVAEMDRFGAALDIFLRLQDERGIQIITSANGRFSMRPGGDRYVTLSQGRRTFENNDGELQLLDFASAEISLPVPRQVATESDQVTWSWQRLRAVNDRAARTEMQWRLAHPFMMLALLVWLHGMIRTDRRRGMHAGSVDMVIMALLYVIYLNLLNLISVRMASGALAVFPGYWWAHLLILVAAVLWQLHWPRRWPRRWLIWLRGQRA